MAEKDERTVLRRYFDALPPKYPNALDEWVRVSQETAYRLYMGEEPCE